VWRGKLETVGTVIFHDTTQKGLRGAGLPTNESIPVINTGETPEYLRQIFPAYSAIIALWLFSWPGSLEEKKPFLVVGFAVGFGSASTLSERVVAFTLDCAECHL
jgi:hypothetical protein